MILAVTSHPRLHADRENFPRLGGSGASAEALDTEVEGGDFEPPAGMNGGSWCGDLRRHDSVS